MPRTATTQPINHNHSTVVQANDNHDYVAVAGFDYLFENDYPDDTARDKFRSMTNRSRFYNQAIREVTQDKRSLRESKDRCVFIIYKGKYPADVLEALKHIVTEWHKAIYKAVDSTADLFKYIGECGKNTQQIKKLCFFSHGYPSLIVFDGTNGSNFDMKEGESLKQDSFAQGARILSYACQTGRFQGKSEWESADNFEASTRAQRNDLYNRSLAQKMADSAKLGGREGGVWAYACRSDYALTYTYPKNNNSMPNPHDAENKENTAAIRTLKNHNTQMEEYERKRIAAVAAGTQPPAPPKLDPKVEQEAKVREFVSEKRTDGYLLRLDGALSPVVAGKSPKGLEREFFKYELGVVRTPSETV